MIDPANWSLLTTSILFGIAAIVIGVVGTRLAELVDRLADLTGLGEAIAGTILLGATTSLPGIITSMTTAAGGYPELAVSNALGGIAAQTVFIAVADIAYRKANLEHAAASVANIFQGTLLIVLLIVPLLAATSPAISIWAIHPVSPLMVIVYIYGVRMARKVQDHPMWHPHRTLETKTDEPDEDQASGRNLVGIWVRFALFAVIVGIAGWLVGQTGENIADQTGISATIVGGVLTAVATSLPELVTSVAAVQRGALTLAVSGIIGGNAFDTLFIAASDITYRDGSIYHAINQQQLFLIALTILLTGILLMGLIRREKRGIGNIGFEGFFILALYIGAFGLFMLTNGNQ